MNTLRFLLFCTVAFMGVAAVPGRYQSCAKFFVGKTLRETITNGMRIEIVVAEKKMDFNFKRWFVVNKLAKLFADYEKRRITTTEFAIRFAESLDIEIDYNGKLWGLASRTISLIDDLEIMETEWQQSGLYLTTYEKESEIASDTDLQWI